MSMLNAVILAAGGGTRMKSETAKVLHPICGRPMILYAIEQALGAGVKQPVVVLGGDTAEEIAPHLPKDVKLAVQPKALGTGDAVLAARKALGGVRGDLLVLYGDAPLVRRTTIQRLAESHHKTGATVTLLSTHVADPAGYGRIVRDVAGPIIGVVEENEANAAQRAIREINVGPLIATAEPLFEALVQYKQAHTPKELYLTKMIAIIAQTPGAKIQTARVETVQEALGINNRAALAEATAIVRQRILDQHLAAGVTLIDPKTTYIDHDVSIGSDTIIFPGTVIESGVVIGKRCRIGPYARLRPGVTVGDDTRVGNFVELVRAHVGEGVRINHVSYLGDATVGDGANIGAGTITANYDGTAKHPTEIGKGALIGSDTVLIAPVKVGAEAVTGAGSVLPKGQDVPPRMMAMGVPAKVVGPAKKPPAEPAKSAKAKAKPKAAAKLKSKPKPKAKAKSPAKKRKLAAARR